MRCYQALEMANTQGLHRKCQPFQQQPTSYMLQATGVLAKDERCRPTTKVKKNYQRLNDTHKMI